MSYFAKIVMVLFFVSSLNCNACEKRDALKLRPGQSGDEGALYSMICEFAEYEKRDVASLPLSKENLKKYGFNSKHPLFYIEFAEVDNKIVGYALYFFTFSGFQGLPILYMKDLYVTPEYRRQGIGKALIKQLSTYAKERNCCRLEWIVSEWNSSAINFYGSLGGQLKKDSFRVFLDPSYLISN